MKTYTITEINIYVVLHDYGTGRYKKYESTFYDIAQECAEQLKSEIYSEYGPETDDNYVWVKAYDLNDPDDREEYDELREY